MLLFSGLSIAQPAAATTILITYTGTVSSGYDFSGVFGASTTSLTGDTFKSVYTLTYPTTGVTDYNIGSTHYVKGGSDFSTLSPVSGQLTINGITQSFDGKVVGEHLLASLDSGIAEVLDVAGAVRQPNENSIFNRIYSMTDNFITSTSFADSFNYAVTANDHSSGTFNIVSNNGDESAFGVLESLTVSIQSVSAVPEPATWGMMIFGFGIAGVTLRARRRETALA